MVATAEEMEVQKQLMDAGDVEGCTHWAASASHGQAFVRGFSRHAACLRFARNTTHASEAQ